MARVLFMGTPDASVPSLDALLSKHEVALVVTQPDRPRGRSNRPIPPPVKRAASDAGLRISQPKSTADLTAVLEEAGPFDLGVVVAYGRILRSDMLARSDHGFLNVHFSLLPRWRGAAPVERALMAGDTMTGVTIMEMDQGLDTGSVLTAQAVDIATEENAGQLTTRLASLGARLLVDSIGPYLEGDLEPVTQTDEGATYAEKITSEDRPISPTDDVVSVHNKVRGLAPSPAATLDIDGVAHKIFEVRAADSHLPQGSWQIIDGVPVVGFADGGVELVSLQPPGKKRLDGTAWARGRHDTGGVVS